MVVLAMDADPTELARRQSWSVAARFLDFDARQAARLAFWRWLASQRGETSRRAPLERRLVVDSWQYGLRVDD